VCIIPVPVAIERTVASASFFIVTSLVEPCPVKINPSEAVYPIAALSLAAVSPEGSIVPDVKCSVPITSSAIFAFVTASAAILAVYTIPSAISLAVKAAGVGVLPI